MSYSRVVSVAFVLWEVGPILRHGSNYEQKVCGIAPGRLKCRQGDTLHILGIKCSGIVAHSV